MRRRTSAQPEGWVMLTLVGPTAIDALITSFCATPAGLVIVSVVDPPPPTPRSARIWVVPGYEVAAPFVAVFAPVAPAVACTAVLPSSVMPPVVLPPETSTGSGIVASPVQ